MTEDEAHKKWCPFTRVATDDNSATNRWMDDPFIGNKPYCIGARCMAWRETKAASYEHAPRADSLVTVRRRVEPEGFCGLAGSAR